MNGLTFDRKTDRIACESHLEQIPKRNRRELIGYSSMAGCWWCIHEFRLVKPIG